MTFVLINRRFPQFAADPFYFSSRRFRGKGMLFYMKLTLSLAAILSAGSIFAQTPEYGPAKGTLVIQGGGSAEGTGSVETFINNAGGRGAKVGEVPTAGGNKNPD